MVVLDLSCTDIVCHGIYKVTAVPIVFAKVTIKT